MKEPLLYRITRPIIKLFMKLFFRPTYKGLENITSVESCILAGNHTSNLDCLLLISATNKTIHFLAKDSLAKGLKKYLFLNMGIIPVNRKIHDKNALNAGINALRENKTIAIFPEGTINKTKDNVMPFKIGAVKMAKETNTTIVPFTIKNKYKLFRKSVEIEFLHPYKITTKKEDLTEENIKLMNIISKSLES